MPKSKRPAMKRAKKSMAKSKVRKAKKNMDTFFLRAKSVFTQRPAQGTTVANYIAGGTALYSGNLLDNAEFRLYAGLYDRFRINRCYVTATPKANVFSSAEAQADGLLNLVGDGLIHTVIDRDGPPPMNVARLTRYPSYKAISLLKKWTRRYDVKYPTSVWLDCQDLPGAGCRAGIAAPQCSRP